jgi:signal peptidase II
LTRTLLIGSTVTVADQLTKHWVRTRFAYGESRPVIDGFFNLVYVRNPGAAWGLLGGQTLFLILLALAILTAFFLFRDRLLHNAPARSLLLGLLLGGVLGNLIDRIRDGWVTDFLDFHLAGYHWPAFNVADASICTAMAVYFISTLLHEHQDRTRSRREDQADETA